MSQERPEKASQKPIDPIAAAEAIMNGYKDAPPIEYKGAQALYSPNKDSTTLPERKHFATSEEFYSTAFHEMVHSTGHESRLDRDLKTGFGSQSYRPEAQVWVCSEFANGILLLTKSYNAVY